MGTAGINGDLTYESYTGCLLYMTVDSKVPSFNKSYCQFPVIGTGVICIFTLFFFGYCTAVVQRYEEFLPTIMSLVFMGTSAFMAMFSFAICGEIGIGLNIACRTTSSGQSLSQCLINNSFQALYTAQVCAGLMGGIWIVMIVLEYIQFRKKSEYESEQYAQETQAYGQETTEYSHAV
ncbi:hypothetical protein BGX27_011602 [Mortierella sp. AM989]|nr:hypothetical protein BGX27_011602 [Mortierella sp. AM989]